MVAYNSPLTSDNLNSKLISRTTDETASGKIDFLNGINIGGISLVKTSDYFDFDTLESGIAIPRGSIAQRPATPENSIFRYNTETNVFEGYQSGAWVNFRTGSGSANSLSYRSVTTTDSPTVSDDILNLSGASFTVTLPTAVGNSGKVLILTHQGTSLSQVYTLNTTSGQTIGGLASGVYKLVTNQERLEIFSDGANWKIKNHSCDTDWIDSGEGLAGFYTFTISSGSATLGATYTNNGNTYTVAKTVASGLSVIMTGPAAPTSSGTLTKSAGTGDATLTFSAVSGSAYKITATTTAPTFYGSPLVNQMLWRRRGKFITLRVRLHQTSAGLVGSGDYIWPTPANVTIDTTYYSTFTGGTAQSVQSQVAATGVALQHSILGRVTYEGNAQMTVTDWAPYTSTTYRIYGFYANGDSAISPGSTYMPATVATLSYNWEVTFPVSTFQP